jgi:hypothetical protein
MSLRPNSEFSIVNQVQDLLSQRPGRTLPVSASNFPLPSFATTKLELRQMAKTVPLLLTRICIPLNRLDSHPVNFNGEMRAASSDS